MEATTTGVRRVLYEDDPRSTQYLAARDEIESIRSDLSGLRSRLRDVARIEAEFHFDSVAHSSTGALDCVIMALYELVAGRRSFTHRASRSDELWQDVELNPHLYVVRPGTSRKRAG